jgi:hypothetical protein
LEQILFVFKNVNIGWEFTKQLAFLDDDDNNNAISDGQAKNEKNDKDDKSY